jgi:hypothetical protein
MVLIYHGVYHVYTGMFYEQRPELQWSDPQLLLQEPQLLSSFIRSTQWPEHMHMVPVLQEVMSAGASARSGAEARSA